jgi:hypothetical protein
MRQTREIYRSRTYLWEEVNLSVINIVVFEAVDSELMAAPLHEP